MIDYEEVVANIATQFQNGNLIYCRQAIRNMRSDEAASVSVRIYCIFITTNKTTAQSWDEFLRKPQQTKSV